MRHHSGTRQSRDFFVRRRQTKRISVVTKIHCSGAVRTIGVQKTSPQLRSCLQPISAVAASFRRMQNAKILCEEERKIRRSGCQGTDSVTRVPLTSESERATLPTPSRLAFSRRPLTAVSLPSLHFSLQALLKAKTPMPNEQAPRRDSLPLSGSTGGAHAQQPDTSGSLDANNNTNPVSSVVPDLMRVYESMTSGAAPASSQQPMEPLHYDHPHQHHLPVAPAFHPPRSSDWTYANSASIIPPIPENALAVMSAAVSSSSPLPASAKPPPKETTTASSTNRSLRKRSKETADATDTTSSTTRSSSKSSRRKSSKHGGGSSSTTTTTDGRWSKRFAWPEDLHRDFVSSIFDVGLKHASPSAILEHMQPLHEQITSERIKSHLQKYRLHRVKSKQKFMSCYQETLRKLQRQHHHHGSGSSMATTSLGGGEVAGHLTHATMTGEETEAATAAEGATATTTTSSNAEKTPPATESTEAPVPNKQQQQTQDSLVFPRLTEEEKSSPIGASMGYLMGLFFTLKQQLKVEREMKQQAAATAQQHPVTDVYRSFVQEPETTTTTATSKPPAAARTNQVAANNLMMKREMEMQMAFQNKMRALKQQEEEKLYKTTDEKLLLTTTAAAAAVTTEAPTLSARDFQGAGEEPPHGSEEEPTTTTTTQQQQRQRGMSSLGEDFWNTDVVDDQLFEFLMNS